MGMQTLRTMFSEFSDEGFVFVDVKVVDGFMDSVTRVWTFVSDTVIREIRGDDYSIESESGPRVEIRNATKISFDKSFE